MNRFHSKSRNSEELSRTIRPRLRKNSSVVNVLSSEPSQLLKIGQIASESGLSVKTIRYYDDIGLLAPNVRRSESGYRLFEPSVLNRLAFVKQAQSLGLTLAEIAQFLDIHDEGELPCGKVKHCLEAKIDSIDEQIKSLEKLRSELRGILSTWKEQPSAELRSKTICPNIQAT